MANNQTNKRVRIVGNAVIITSKIKFEDIKKLEKYNPDALALCTKDDNGDVVEVFRVATGKVGNINKYGATFATADKNGFATVTTLIPEKIKDKREFVKDNFGPILFILKKFEEHVTETVEEFDKAYAALDDEIEEE